MILYLFDQTRGSFPGPAPAYAVRDRKVGRASPKTPMRAGTYESKNGIRQTRQGDTPYETGGIRRTRQESTVHRRKRSHQTRQDSTAQGPEITRDSRPLL